MKHDTIRSFLDSADGRTGRGPLALIFVEDEVEIGTTLRHHLETGFKTVAVFIPDAFDIPADVTDQVHRISFDLSAGHQLVDAVNEVISACPDRWMYYCYNAEYLFFPFCEQRTIGEMLAFHTEERRGAMLTYVVDLYAGDLGQNPNAVSLETAHLDRSGYYAQGRTDPGTGHAKERQLDFYGGLRWRYEEHIPQRSRRIDRIALFKAKPGLKLHDTHTFNDEEYNTYSCPWHHNLTATICSFRTAKALKRNPGSRFEIDTFTWHNSVPFEWHSRQLLDLGLMEPGQWF